MALSHQMTELVRRLEAQDQLTGDSQKSPTPPTETQSLGPDDGDELELYASDELSEADTASVAATEGTSVPPVDTAHVDQRPSAQGGEFAARHQDTVPSDQGADPLLEAASMEDECTSKLHDVLSIENIDKAVSFLNEFFGLLPPETPPKEGPCAEWRSISDQGQNMSAAASSTRPQLNFDGELHSLFHELAVRRWTSYPLAVDRAITVPEPQYRAILRALPLPTEAWERLSLRRKAKALPSKEGLPTRYELVDKQVKSDMEDYSSFDRAARFGLKISALQFMIGEWLRTSSPDKRDTEHWSLLTSILSALSRLHVEQYSRVAVKATTLRRARIIPSLGLPEIAARSLQDSSLLGPDLFGGQYTKVVAEEVSRQETFEKTRTTFPSQQPFRGRTATKRGGRTSDKPKAKGSASSRRKFSPRGSKSNRGQPFSSQRGASRGRSTRGKRGGL